MRPALRHWSRGAVLLCGLFGFSGGSVAGPVFACHGPDGIPAFRQFPCPEAQSEAAELALDEPQTVHIPPLSALERRRLDALQEDLQARRQTRRSARQQAARQARQAQRSRHRRCQSARLELAALARQRRKGYSLGQARELTRRAEFLDAEVRDSC